eukprot:SAG31_NODE_2399_length_5776_cov_8.236216_1_plen_339_part_00
MHEHVQACVGATSPPFTPPRLPDEENADIGSALMKHIQVSGCDKLDVVSLLLFTPSVGLTLLAHQAEVAEQLENLPGPTRSSSAMMQQSAGDFSSVQPRRESACAVDSTAPVDDLLNYLPCTRGDEFGDEGKTETSRHVDRMAEMDSLCMSECTTDRQSCTTNQGQEAGTVQCVFPLDSPNIKHRTGHVAQWLTAAAVAVAQDSAKSTSCQDDTIADRHGAYVNSKCPDIITPFENVHAAFGPGTGLSFIMRRFPPSGSSESIRPQVAQRPWPSEISTSRPCGNDSPYSDERTGSKCEKGYQICGNVLMNQSKQSFADRFQQDSTDDSRQRSTEKGQL